MTGPSLFEMGDETSMAGDEAAQTRERDTSVPYQDGPISLYRKYRPQALTGSDLVGQDHIVRTLRNAVVLDRVAHAYLFGGPRGTGKTTTARLLAKAVNCLADDRERRPCNACASCVAINASASPDIIEIDAASNRGIDDIRDLRERVRFAPAQLRSKVYIVDEAHQITGAAANAFLKTLEEPPAHSRFILATTDPEELLPTIVSRCQRFEFHRVSVEDMSRRLRYVSERESITITDQALRAIARHATGSVRDALALLEQLMLQAAGPNPQPIDLDDVQRLLGLSRNDRVEAIVEALSRHSAGDALRVVQAAVDDGEDPRQLNRQLVAFLRMMLIERSGESRLTEGSDLSHQLASAFSLSEIAAHARRFSEIDFTIKHSPYPQLPLEIALVEAALAARVPQPAAPEPPLTALAPPPKPTSLRDRVRNQQPNRGAPEAEVAPVARTQTATITRFPGQHEEPANLQTAVSGVLDVNAIADLWPNVRSDVKALNRRIEALLSEVDPVAVSGNLITLAVPYPFHRDKLNSDEVRETVAGVLSRLLQREMSITCVLRGEFAPTPTSSASASIQSQPPDRRHDEDKEEDEHTRMRIQAAKNIFDAEEIDDVPLAATIAASDEG